MTEERSRIIVNSSLGGSRSSVLRCLIVDDEADIRSTLGLCLETLGHQVLEAATAEEAVQAIAASPVEVAFVDVRLGTSSGLNLIPQLLAQSPRLKILVITAYASVGVAVQAMSRGATDILCKPFTPEQVATALTRVAELLALEHNVGALHDRSGTFGPEADFATASAHVQQAVTAARQAAPSSSAILIAGERGTGMRVLARAIHGWSRREDGPYRCIHCVQSSQAYVDLTLFGETVVGGKAALSDKHTLVDESAGGTLVVAHVEALSPRSQGKLLRLIDKGLYEIPGTTQTRKCDVRVIATMSPAVAGEATQMAPELLALLQPNCISLPPLRQRIDDIYILAQRYLAFVRQLAGKSVLGFGADSLALLKSYDWPGNLYELRQVVEEAVRQCDGSYVEPRNLPAHIRMVQEGQVKQICIGDSVPMEAIEEQHIRSVLASAKSLQEAGEILGMDYQTLYRRRKQFGI